MQGSVSLGYFAGCVIAGGLRSSEFKLKLLQCRGLGCRLRFGAICSGAFLLDSGGCLGCLLLLPPGFFARLFLHARQL